MLRADLVAQVPHVDVDNVGTGVEVVSPHLREQLLTAEANLLVSGGSDHRLLDIDYVGPGHRVDDLACLLGHALVLPCLAPTTYPFAPAAVQRWLAAFDEVVDAAARATLARDWADAAMRVV